jgi:hypothetical protein
MAATIALETIGPTPGTVISRSQSLSCRASASISQPQHNCPALIVAHDVKRVLADIDADQGDTRIELAGHGVLLVFGAPCQLRLLVGPEHGRTIPLPDISGPLLLRCTARCNT